ncbi:MAG TPA: hypothetical protein EYH00_00210 [Archaeoglobus profundus]|nr:hypothetical protein [Archaeoglobus profundus]
MPFGNLSWYLDEININDICFIKISGDDALKSISYDNSLVAIVKVIRRPYDIHVPLGMVMPHGTIDLEFLDIFNGIVADDLYKFPTLKNTLSIGASTKGVPNQAIGRLQHLQGEDIIKALIAEGRLTHAHLSTYGISNDSIEVLTSTIINV